MNGSSIYGAHRAWSRLRGRRTGTVDWPDVSNSWKSRTFTLHFAVPVQLQLLFGWVGSAGWARIGGRRATAAETGFGDGMELGEGGFVDFRFCNPTEACY